MQHSFEEFSEKQRRVELKYVGNFVAKTVLVESSNHFSFEELCFTQYSLQYFSKPYRPSDPLEKPLVISQPIRVLTNFMTFETELDLHRITNGFHGALSNGAALQQGTLTLPDTLFDPFWNWLMLQLLTPVSELDMSFLDFSH